jgi:hypothetical protein
MMQAMSARVSFKVSDEVREVLARSTITPTSVKLPDGQLGGTLLVKIQDFLTVKPDPIYDAVIMRYNGGKNYTIKRWGMGDFWREYLAANPVKRFCQAARLIEAPT